MLAMTDRKAKKKWQYMAEYKCGCTDVQDFRNLLLEYCGKHGDDRRRIYRLPVKGKLLEKGLTA